MKTSIGETDEGHPLQEESTSLAKAMETFLRLLKLYACSWKTLPNFGMSALDGKNGLGPPALRNREVAEHPGLHSDGLTRHSCGPIPKWRKLVLQRDCEGIRAHDA
jgi:hypothetical protein